MKTKEEKKLRKENINKMKRQVSIITVFLWIFLVATLVTIVVGNVKNTNALEGNVEIYDENLDGNIPIQYASSFAPPNISNIQGNISIRITCENSSSHSLSYNALPSNDAIIVKNMAQNTGTTGMSSSIYPMMCDIELNPEFFINAFSNYEEQNGLEKHYIVSNNMTLRLFYSTRNNGWIIYNSSSQPLIIEVSHAKPTLNSIVGSGGNPVVRIVCKDSQDHFLEATNLLRNDAIIPGEILENDDSDPDVPSSTYPWMCDIKLNTNIWLNEYNSFANRNNFGEHFIVSNDETLRLYHDSKNSKWTYKEGSIPLEIEVTHIKEEYIVTYTDGVSNDLIFPDQTYECLLEGEKTPKFNGIPFREGYIFTGWAPSVNPVVSGDDSNEFGEIIYTATWSKIIPPKRYELDGILKKFVTVHCVNESNRHEDKMYSTSDVTVDGLYEATVGDVYYSKENNLYLCDVILNGKVYSKMYSMELEIDTGVEHYLVKDNDFNKPAEYYEDINKKITLKYDENTNEWKALDESKLPIIFNVRCNLHMFEGFYKVKHEYYLKDKNGNLMLEDTFDTSNFMVAFKYNEKIKVGISSELDRVDIEVEKRYNNKINDEEYTYEYFENSGNVIIEEDVTKEITLKYVREEQEESTKDVNIKVEKVWEDNNNEYGKRPDSVVLQVYNGNELVEEILVSEENNWSYEFKLPKYDELGNEINYTVDEKDTPEYYEKNVSGYVVTNKYVEKEIITDTENPVDTSDINIWLYLGIAIISIIVIFIVVIFEKKNKKENK